MSHQGPPGGSYPDPPYDPPSDPWGGHEEAWHDPTVPQPGYRGSPSHHAPDSSYGGQPSVAGAPYQSAGAPTPVWEPVSRAEPEMAPSPPPDRRGSTLLFVAVGMLVLVIAAAVGYAFFLLSGDDVDTVGGGGAPAITPPSGVASASPDPGSTQDNIGLNAAMAQVGDCLTNLGTDLEPQLQVVSCEEEQDGPVYEVLEKFEVRVEGANREEQDASAQDTCGDVEGYTHHYYEVSPSLSFVLCMAEQ